MLPISLFFLLQGIPFLSQESTYLERPFTRTTANNFQQVRTIASHELLHELLRQKVGVLTYGRQSRRLDRTYKSPRSQEFGFQLSLLFSATKMTRQPGHWSERGEYNILFLGSILVISSQNSSALGYREFTQEGPMTISPYAAREGTSAPWPNVKKCCRHLVPSSDFFVQSYAVHIFVGFPPQKTFSQGKFLRVRRGCQASQRKGGPPGKSGKLPGKSGELPGKSGKLPGNPWIAVKFHSERTSGEVAEKLPGKFGELPGKSGDFPEARGSLTPSQRLAKFVSNLDLVERSRFINSPGVQFINHPACSL